MNQQLNLAITKIGDLLIESKITQDLTGNSIHNVDLLIPEYQRPYKWTSKNVLQLLEDIIDAKNASKETYRVGTLILHQSEFNLENGQKKSVYNIVDGQQRTITFSLLLRLLSSSFQIAFLDNEIWNNAHTTRNIKTNYRTLERRLDNLEDEKEKNALCDFIRNNCELIVVITNDISEAFQFFDSQNARGKKLYPHDLLKAYHLREMSEMDESNTEKTVKIWEDLDQKKLAGLFSDYLYRIKEWIKGNRAFQLNEHNMEKFKGITLHDNFPYAQFYKSAFAYSEMVNNSAMPFVSGSRNLKAFQLDTPIIAGKPFFDYAKHYFDVLKDIQDNSKYVGYFINGNEIVKTLDLPKYKNGVGNKITRLLFDTAILLYVDRFCPEKPNKLDLDLLEQFVVFAFIWSYSLRAQYTNLGWHSAQNFILELDGKLINSFNLYKEITESDSPLTLFSKLSEKIQPLDRKQLKSNQDKIDLIEAEIPQNFLYYFNKNKFLI
jgi:uncharacterized protein with ParB-like and HNH nuclease domain